MTKNKLVKHIGRVALLLVLSCSHSRAENCPGMEDFWVNFRRAVITGETTKVASITRFPLPVGGILDSHPIVKYDRKSFPRIFAQLLRQNIVVVEKEGSIVDKTMLQHVLGKKSIVAKDYNTPCMVTVELFEFQYSKGKWEFTGAYLEE